MNELSLLETSASPDTDDPLVSYSYSYPHKSSYKRFDVPVSVRDIWSGEDLSRLGLYVHVPFCEMRCGFCNLFAESRPHAEFVSDYLATLRRQMGVWRSAVHFGSFSQFAIGGGTPTFLSADELYRLLKDVEAICGLQIRNVPTSVETSPATADDDRLGVLADFGVQRISLGVQSFVSEDSGLLGRPQSLQEVHEALGKIRNYRFPVLNIDLIYGHPEQSLERWERSLESALEYDPEELYLYPLYVRPQTGLARQNHQNPGHRIDQYRAAREKLMKCGYQELSMRCFRKPEILDQGDFRCQSDSTVGFGCGARSYTSKLHFSNRFAVTKEGVRAILNEWIHQSDEELEFATHGFILSEEDRRRRYLILSVLQADGLELTDYRQRFGSDPREHFVELREMIVWQWLAEVQGRLKLTDVGMEKSDLVGPMLYSAAVRSRLREFIKP